ncbi:MAG TPA: hypothetical protein PL044_11520 [Clostridiales bacterium]|nr:hypothetical protein [Clostridiales bacterium]HQH63136.1 hypothetical protein [Clostridiales bacterium]HQK74386.1 hypothetical protein [Clostridiales bacterium]
MKQKPGRGVPAIRNSCLPHGSENVTENNREYQTVSWENDFE